MLHQKISLISIEAVRITQINYFVWINCLVEKLKSKQKQNIS